MVVVVVVGYVSPSQHHPPPSPSRTLGGAAVRRRQPEEPPGEGEAGRVPHAPLHPPRLPEPAAGHDRGGRHQETHGALGGHALTTEHIPSPIMTHDPALLLYLCGARDMYEAICTHHAFCLWMAVNCMCPQRCLRY